MNIMTIERAKDEKDELEFRILKAVVDFERNTGLSVKGLFLQSIKDCNAQPRAIAVDVEVTI